MKKFFKRMRKSQGGQTATEYMLIVAVLVAVVVAGAAIFGNRIKAGITNMAGDVETSLSEACIPTQDNPC